MRKFNNLRRNTYKLKKSYRNCQISLITLSKERSKISDFTQDNKSKTQRNGSKKSANNKNPKTNIKDTSQQSNKSHKWHKISNKALISSIKKWAENKDKPPTNRDTSKDIIKTTHSASTPSALHTLVTILEIAAEAGTLLSMDTVQVFSEASPISSDFIITFIIITYSYQ